MKKVLATALVALMVASTVFAGFAGSADVKLGYDFDKGTYGFVNGKLVDFDFDISTLDGAAQGEGEVYASIKGSLKLSLNDGNDDDPVAAPVTEPTTVFKADITEAKVAGENWSVSILNSGKTLDLAKNAVDKAKYELPYATAAGITADVYGYGVGFGLEGNAKTEAVKTNGYFRTKAFTLAEGMTLQAGVQASFEKAGAKTAGGSVAFAYDANNIKAAVASDLGLTFTKNAENKAEAKVAADVAAKFGYDFITADLYYKTDDYLSVKVAADLNSLDVPVTVAFTGSDLVNKQELNLEAGYDDKTLAVKGNVGYAVAAKEWNTGASVSYKLDKVGTIAAGFGLKGADKLTDASVNVSLTNDTLINGAVLQAKYAATNFVTEEYGALTTSCTIKF